mmetsp:Transcript_103119/g.332655  ORF Transcript_103119/g.332655 Transcript_103119/m.332655 type:complete len:390 (-) Transcript_103119:136-1305(-)
MRPALSRSARVKRARKWSEETSLPMSARISRTPAMFSSPVLWRSAMQKATRYSLTSRSLKPSSWLAYSRSSVCRMVAFHSRTRRMKYVKGMMSSDGGWKPHSLASSRNLEIRSCSSELVGAIPSSSSALKTSRMPNAVSPAPRILRMRSKRGCNSSCMDCCRLVRTLLTTLRKPWKLRLPGLLNSPQCAKMDFLGARSSAKQPSHESAIRRMIASLSAWCLGTSPRLCRAPQASLCCRKPTRSSSYCWKSSRMADSSLRNSRKSLGSLTPSSWASRRCSSEACCSLASCRCSMMASSSATQKLLPLRSLATGEALRLEDWRDPGTASSSASSASPRPCLLPENAANHSPNLALSCSLRGAKCSSSNTCNTVDSSSCWLSKTPKRWNWLK